MSRLPNGTLPRFGSAARVAHWTLAIPFLLLLTTGLLLYVPPAKALHVGGYRVVPLIHVLLGIAFLPALGLALLAQPRRRALYADLRRLFRLEPGDGAWTAFAVRSLLGARMRQPPTGKFNAGQKANTAVSAAFTIGLIATGLVLAVNFFSKAVFGARFVEQVYTWHDAFVVIAIPVVAGHIYLATLNPPTRASLPGMIGGRVDRAWARAHHDRWVEELQGEDGPSGRSPT